MLLKRQGKVHISCSWIFSLNIVSWWRSFHITLGSTSSPVFFLNLELQSMLLNIYSMFNQCPLNGHLGDFLSYLFQTTQQWQISYIYHFTCLGIYAWQILRTEVACLAICELIPLYRNYTNFPLSPLTHRNAHFPTTMSRENHQNFRLLPIWRVSKWPLAVVLIFSIF